jgi:molecular chaperone DnaK
MDKMINYGIDLGTTNSVIAKFIKGKIEVLRNPQDWRETLPSVVYYKKDKVVVGKKAKEFLSKGEDPSQVFSRFKRLLGTTETKRVKVLDASKTPVELSTEVLKELKGFNQSGEQIEAAVITIPASFNIPQSNATSEAGYLAGFKQVILLPEPIAASLAYAISQSLSDLENKQWLVYDFGGGTFDVALVKIKDGELKVIDHEGDNFLGGADFDDLIVEKIIIPYLTKSFKFTDLESKMKSASGIYNSFYYKCLFAAEEAKIALSNKSSAEIELNGIKDEEDTIVDNTFDITRSEFESLIKDSVNGTIDMIKKILVRNSLKSSDIQFTLMIGGSTYIPFVRKRVEEILQIPANCSIDPTTAVAIGAAYFAGTKEKNFGKETDKKSASGLKIRFAYSKTSDVDEEMFAGKFEGNIDGLFYRIVREDKGFDSGVKPLSARISEDLPLVKEAFNYFKFTILDAQNNIVDSDIELIGIRRDSINSGETPIAHDICIEVDDDNELIDLNKSKTILETVFLRNTFLPTKKTLYKYLNKNVMNDTNDKVIFNLLEGPHTNIPQANTTIGYLEIKGSSLPSDIYKGDELEIKIEMSASREIKASVYFPRINKEFGGIYKGKESSLTVEKFKNEVLLLNERLEFEMNEAVDSQRYEDADQLKELKKQVDELIEISDKMPDDDSTDKIHREIVKKRKLAQEIDDATKNKRTELLKSEYVKDKEWCQKIVNSDGNDQDHKIFNDIIIREQIFLKAINPIKIKEAIDDLNNLAFNILWRTPDWLVNKFNRLIEKPQLFRDQNHAKSLMEAGHVAISNKNFDRLRQINFDLIDQLPGTTPNSSSKQDKDGSIGWYKS